MSVSPSAITFEVKINNVWEDITRDVVLDQSFEYGIDGNSRINRVASTGTMSITLRNDSSCIGGVAGYYSPSHASAKSGWKIGLPFRLKIAYYGETFTKFTGHIANIDIQSGLSEKRVFVTVVDWFDYAANQPLIIDNVAYNQRIDETIPVILSGIPIIPSGLSLYTGTYTFPSVFDTVRSNTKAVSELTKLAFSEMGYIYLRHIDDTLVVEGRTTRHGGRTVATTPITPEFSSKLLMETSEYLLLETGDKILLDATESANFDNSFTNIAVSYGDNINNEIQVRAYPRKVDEDVTVLYSFDKSISLLRNATVSGLQANYRDFNAGASYVAGFDMVIPSGGVDYLFNSKADGTGTDLTANLSVVADYKVEKVEYTLVNTSSTQDGYVTKLQARGKGVYIYDPITSIATDTNSINTYGYKPFVYEMKYQDTADTAISVAKTWLSEDKDPRTTASFITCIANTSDSLMRAFLFLEIGDLIYIKESQTGIDGYYYIQKIKAKIHNDLITFTFEVIEALSLQEDYWLLEVVGASELDSTTVLGY